MNSSETLLLTAQRLFATRGYHSVGVQQIVNEAGVTKPTLYHHYGSKAGLLSAIYQAGRDSLFSYLEPFLTYQGDLPTSIEGLTKTLFRFCQENPDFTRLYLSLSVASPEDETAELTAPLYTEVFDTLRNLFSNAAQQHGNMYGREDLTTTSFLGMVYVYMGMGLNGAAHLDEQLAFWAAKQFMHGIYS